MQNHYSVIKLLKGLKLKLWTKFPVFSHYTYITNDKKKFANFYRDLSDNKGW